jgi:D-amino peptidase
VLIISDMEGVSGIVKWAQVSAGQAGYEEGRRLYTEEINAAVRGACEAGADEVVVMDHHGAGGAYSFNSLVHDMLDARCDYVIQESWTSYTEALEQGCDAVLLIAMHAMAGTPDGVMCHTVSGSQWTNLRFNGRLVGETGINAAFCGHWGCPVALVTGDEASCREARELLGDGLHTVAVKKGLGRFSARNIAPQRARRMIEEGARAALKDLGAVAPYIPPRPTEIEVEFVGPDALEQYRNKPGIEVLGPRKLVARGQDWWTAWRQFYH